MYDQPAQDFDPQLNIANGQASPQRYKLCLYVTGNTPRSVRAIHNLRRIIEQRLGGCADLEVVDLYQQMERSVEDEKLVATPMLVRTLPLPERRLIGDLSNETRVLMTLDLDDQRAGEPD